MLYNRLSFDTYPHGTSGLPGDLRYAEVSKETYLYGKRGLLTFAYLRSSWRQAVFPFARERGAKVGGMGEREAGRQETEGERSSEREGGGATGAIWRLCLWHGIWHGHVVWSGGCEFVGGGAECGHGCGIFPLYLKPNHRY